MNQLTYESEIIKEIITVIKVFNIRVDGYLPLHSIKLQLLEKGVNNCDSQRGLEWLVAEGLISSNTEDSFKLTQGGFDKI